MEILKKVAVVTVSCAFVVVALSEFAKLQSDVVFGCIAFAAFWIAVGMLTPLAGKIMSLLRDDGEGMARDALGRCVAALTACLSIVALCIYSVIVPVVGVARVEQTGAGSLWLVCSMIAVPIALPLAVSLVERLHEGK